MQTAIPRAASSTALHPADTAYTAATEGLNGLSLAVILHDTGAPQRLPVLLCFIAVIWVRKR